MTFQMRLTEPGQSVWYKSFCFASDRLGGIFFPVLRDKIEENHVDFNKNFRFNLWIVSSSHLNKIFYPNKISNQTYHPSTK